VGAVLVHIDLDGDRPHPSSLLALAAGRAVASSWGATLYAALVVRDDEERERDPAESTGRIGGSTKQVRAIEATRAALARAGADKIVVALTDVTLAPLWAAIGAPWQGILDHLRPRLVLFGADAPATGELGPRTAARIGARLLLRARAIGVDLVELRDRDGGYVRASDGGAAVAMIGGARAAYQGDDDIDVVVLSLPGGADDRVEIAGSAPAELVHGRAIVAISDDMANDKQIASGATKLAALLGAPVVGSSAAARAGAVTAGAVIERAAPIAPEVCVTIGTPSLDLAGCSSLIRIGGGAGKGADGSLTGGAAANLAQLVRALEET
jgi:electron transfer flavoprotein alpha subunit